MFAWVHVVVPVNVVSLKRSIIFIKQLLMIKVIFNGSMMLLKATESNAQLVEQLRAESEAKHLRFESRIGRARHIFYYDYDKPKDDAES